MLEPALPTTPLPPASGLPVGCLPQEGLGGTQDWRWGLCHQGNPTPLPRWSSLCPGWLQADPVGRATQGQAGAARDAPQLGCLLHSSVLNYLFSRSCLTCGQHLCVPGEVWAQLRHQAQGWHGSWAEQGFAAQPRLQCVCQRLSLAPVRKPLCPL